MTAPTAIDLFCGAGGLTEGLKQAGFEVLAGIDNLPLALEAYAANHPRSRAIEGDLQKLDPLAVANSLGVNVGELDLLAGCPPCQGFSAVRVKRAGLTSVEDPRNRLVARFVHWAEKLRPRTVLMENVPLLERDVRFRRVVRRLETAGYEVHAEVLDVGEFGVPQRRKRLVLVASLAGRVTIDGSGAARPGTVREAIGHLPFPSSSTDPLHNHGETRSDAVVARIAAVPKDGGSLRKAGSEHQLDCHARTNGFYDVYGRMAWDRPAPTMTTGCINPSKGRFLHPEQDRAITLREAALLQSFPGDYKFPLSGGKYAAAALIGNALPPAFAAPQGRALLAHLAGNDVGI